MKKILSFLAVLTLTGLAGVAFGLDPSHDKSISCDSCHVSHNSLSSGMTNADSNANLCLSCHTSTGMAGKKLFVDNMKATPGGTGTSHKWDVPVYNPSRGTSFPTNPELIARLDPITIGLVYEDATNRTTIKNLNTNYDPPDSLKGKSIQFFSYLSQVSCGSLACKATGGSSTQLTDSTLNWTVNSWAGYYVSVTKNVSKKGTKGGKTSSKTIEARRILMNDANTLTVSEDFTNIIAAKTCSNSAYSTETDCIGNNGTWTEYSYEILNPSYANSGIVNKITGNTANSITFDEFPQSPRGNEKYAIMDELNTKFSCSTCHNQHLQKANPWDPFADTDYLSSEDAAKLSDPSKASNNRKFLRIDNDKNQLCVECHRERGSVSAIDTRTYNEKSKSHPVGRGLSEVVNPHQFNSASDQLSPLETNNAAQTGSPRFRDNGTGDSNSTNNIVLDQEGKVRCLSCHGIHYTDSNATTEDKP